MRNSRPRLRRLLVLAVVMAASHAGAQPLAEHVPADTQVYIGWSGADSMGPGFEGSNFQGFLKAVDLPRLTGQVMAMAKTFTQAQAGPKDAAMFDLLAEVVGALWRNPTAIYFAGIDNSNPNQLMPRVAILCRMGDGAATLRDKVLKAGGPPPPPPIVFDAVDGVLVLAVGMSAQDAVKPASALSGAARFKEAMGLVHQPASAVLYVDTPGVLKMVTGLVQREAPPGDFATYQKVVEALGLNGVGRLVASGGFHGKDWMTAAFLEAPAPRKGLLKAVESGPLDPSTLKVVPSTAPWLSVTRLDLSNAYDTALQAVAEIDPQVLPQLDRALADANRELGFDIVNDLIRTLGSDWVVYSDLSLGGPPTSTFTLVHPLRDAARFDKTLTHIEEKFGPMLANLQQEGVQALNLQRVQSGDVTIRSINVLIYAPSWAVHDGRLFIGLYPQAVAAAADNAKAEGPTILDDPRFQAVMKELGDHPINAVAYTDLKQTAPQMYQLALMGVQLVQGLSQRGGGQNNQLLLPPLGKLMPYFQPLGQAGWADEKGFHGRSLSPFPGSSVFAPSSALTSGVAGGALGMGILLPSLGRACELANRSMAATRLRGIYMAAEVYAIANDGRYPQRPGDLVLDGSVSPKNFINPRAKTPEPQTDNIEELARWTNEHSDFVIRFDRFAQDAPADRVLGYEKIQPGVIEGLNILYGDGHVAFASEAEALRILKEAGESVPDRLPGHPSSGPGDLFNFLNPTPKAPTVNSPGEAWYYDTVTGEYFTAETTKVAPFVNDAGNESVRAHFFTCGECADGQRFIGYYEKYTDEVKKKIEEGGNNFAIYELAFQGRLYSKDGQKWVAADKPEGIQITSDLQKQCPPKKLRYCPPG